MPPQITCASVLPGKTEKHKNQMSALPEFNQLFDFFNLFDSRLILKMLYDSLNLVINAFRLQGCCGGIVQEKGSRQRSSSWTELQAQCTSALSSKFPLSQGNAEALDR